MTGKNFSTNNVSGKRKKSDFYETPYSITQAILDRESLLGTVLEPAAGGGAIVKVLSENGISCTSYDIEVNFFTEKNKYDVVITNPPFSLANDFITKAKEVANNKIIFLLPLSYLHGKYRYDNIYSDTNFPLVRVYVFTRYPMLGDKLRDDGKYRTGMMVYAWFVFEKNSKQPSPTLHWIDNNDFVLNKRVN